LIYLIGDLPILLGNQNYKIYEKLRDISPSI